MVIPRALLFPLPDRRYPLYAAGLCPVATALHAIKKAKIRPGMSALVTGAGGGVGWALVQVLRSHGVTVFAATSPPKAEALESLGAYPVTTPRYRKAIRDVDEAYRRLKTREIQGRAVLVVESSRV